MELYAEVRLAVVEERLSHREAVWRFEIERQTKPVWRPKLDGLTGISDAILEAETDPDVPRKQPSRRSLLSSVIAPPATRGSR